MFGRDWEFARGRAIQREVRGDVYRADEPFGDGVAEEHEHSGSLRERIGR